VSAGRHLAGWYARAGVRRDPRRCLGPTEAEPPAQFFPPALVPVMAHPKIIALDREARGRLLVEHLYRYLDFTVNFELNVVNVTAGRIATGHSGFELPDGTRLAAFGIYCDEAYHALYCADVMHQVEQRTGIPCRPPSFAPFAARLAAIVDAVPPPVRPAAALLVVVVFETLVTRILERVPQDPHVVACVREVVGDHARDERRHHAFFASLFALVWPQLSPGDRAALGPVLPEMIRCSLQPDTPAIVDSLRGVGLTRDDALTVVADSHRPEMVAADMRSTARATLGLFERNRLFHHAPTREAFVASGLLRIRRHS
jgi:hypothetical protein